MTYAFDMESAFFAGPEEGEDALLLLEDVLNALDSVLSSPSLAEFAARWQAALRDAMERIECLLAAQQWEAREMAAALDAPRAFLQEGSGLPQLTVLRESVEALGDAQAPSAEPSERSRIDSFYEKLAVESDLLPPVIGVARRLGYHAFLLFGNSANPALRGGVEDLVFAAQAFSDHANRQWLDGHASSLTPIQAARLAELADQAMMRFWETVPHLEENAAAQVCALMEAYRDAKLPDGKTAEEALRGIQRDPTAFLRPDHERRQGPAVLPLRR